MEEPTVKIGVETQVLEDIVSLSNALCTEATHAEKYNTLRNKTDSMSRWMAHHHLTCALWWRSDCEAWMRLMEMENY
jgi:hypothetical protein